MKKSRPRAKRVVRQWAKATRRGGLLERWRRECSNLRVELTQPRVIDVVPIDFIRGEAAEQKPAAAGTRKFRGRLIYFTNADITIRRPSGAILVIDLYEIASLSDGQNRIEPPPAGSG